MVAQPILGLALASAKSATIAASQAHLLQVATGHRTQPYTAGQLWQSVCPGEQLH